MRSTLLLVLLALGCSGSEDAAPATTTDAATSDVATDSAPADTASDAAPVDTGATCDLGAVPTVAPFDAAFEFVDADAGVTFPAPTGGDPKGTWRYSKITIYLSPAAKSLVDISKSKVEGWGFAEYGETTFRNWTEQKITLETTVVGTITRGSLTKGKGTYAVEGDKLVYTPECSESSSGGTLPPISWSRLSDDKARLQFRPPPSDTGDNTEQIVIDLELIK